MSDILVAASAGFCFGVAAANYVWLVRQRKLNEGKS